MKYYAPYQFSFFRIFLGLYLCIHFFQLIPYAGEIWSNIGLLSDPTLNFTYGVFPNILYLIDGPIGVSLFVGLLLVFSILLVVGFQRQVVVFLLWYGWVCLFDRNNLINNPGLPYIGWILLSLVVIPAGEPLSLTKSKSLSTDWRFPKIIFIGAWIIMAVGYTISGVDKFYSPSWYDGSAIFHLLENPLARDWWLRDFVVGLPSWFLKINTWFVLSLEMLFLPFCLFSKSRKWVWIAMVCMHIGIMLIVDFADLTMGMLMIHWFTFDGRWFSPKSKQSGIVFFDGVCGLCNKFIDFLIKEDLHNTMQFAPLQGETAKDRLTNNDMEVIDTIIFISDNKVYKKSKGAILAIAGMGGFWKLILMFLIIPNFIRDTIYSYIASNRYEWFGKRKTCRIPTKAEQMKILN
ncbi:MAG: DCC1-like thiol-disulfide oxidoreductase family protein [Saprospiraceae bacterium]